MEIDVTIVAGQRPDLLETTLESFGCHLFDHFEIGMVFVNIDPFCGTDQDGDTCEAMIHETFGKVEIFRPKTPSFGGAVKRLWAKPKRKIFLHLEDDWTMTEELRPDRIKPELHDDVVQVQLSALTKRKSPHRYNYPARWRKIMGLKLGKIYDLNRPLFATSPSFVSAEFAAQCAALMDPDKDPEKQLYSGMTALSEFTRSYRSLTLQARDGGPLVVDHGRDWLAQRNVQKEIDNGVSRWTSKS